MTVWIVYGVYEDVDVVNDELEIQNLDCFEIEAVFSSEYKAEQVANRMNEENEDMVKQYDASPIRYEYAEYKVY